MSRTKDQSHPSNRPTHPTERAVPPGSAHKWTAPLRRGWTGCLLINGPAPFLNKTQVKQLNDDGGKKCLLSCFVAFNRRIKGWI